MSEWYDSLTTVAGGVAQDIIDAAKIYDQATAAPSTVLTPQNPVPIVGSINPAANAGTPTASVAKAPSSASVSPWALAVGLVVLYLLFKG
jgi:hypothetical protein